MKPYPSRKHSTEKLHRFYELIESNFLRLQHRYRYRMKIKNVQTVGCSNELSVS